MRTFSLRNNKGFSLVELMVVVAIIGILASIAIPSLQKYMAKARQSEAKTSLASLYTAEKAFFAEFNTYTTNFLALGFQPEGLLRYATGFSAAGPSGAQGYLNGYGYSGTLTPPSYYSTTTPSSTSDVCDAGGVPGARPCTMTSEANPSGLTAADANASTFTAKASSNIYQGRPDTWSINENKNIANTVQGIL